MKAVRGGAWTTNQKEIQSDLIYSTFRNGDIQSGRGINAGFRIMKQVQNINRVIRGGAWGSYLGRTRSVVRCWLDLNLRDDYIGFRVMKKTT